jgi:phenylacetate-CoA ligase
VPDAIIDFLPLVEQRRIQTVRLREHVRYCREHSPHYGALTQTPDTVTLENLADIPFTDKAQFAVDNARFLAVPPAQIVDIVFSSGTTGEPTPVMYTVEDLARLANNEARAFAASGITAADTALLTCTLDRCFVAGFAYCSGLQKLGAACIRNGISSLESHQAIMRKMRPTVLVGVPVFLRRLGCFLRQNNGAFEAAGVRHLICIGEPLRDEKLNPLAVTRELADLFPNATAHSTYASSECVSPFCECPAGCGGHLLPDIAVLEIVDSAGRRLPDGEVGEVVITPLGIRGMPLLRFRTGDMSFMLTTPCACGRHSPRLGPIIGRRNEMMKVQGTTLYPAAFFNVLDRMQGISQSYVTVTSADRLSDCVCVTAAVCDPALTEAEIVRQLQAVLRVKPQVRIEPEEQVLAVVYTNQSRKPVRFLDRRANERKDGQAT